MKIQKKNKKSISDKKICNIKFRSGTHISEIIFKDSFVFSAEIGCSDMLQEAIAIFWVSTSSPIDRGVKVYTRGPIHDFEIKFFYK